MALIKCSECGREISDKAPACPGCGNPIRNQGNTEIQELVKKEVETEENTENGSLKIGAINKIPKRASLDFVILFFIVDLFLYWIISWSNKVFATGTFWFVAVYIGIPWFLIYYIKMGRISYIIDKDKINISRGIIIKSSNTINYNLVTNVAVERNVFARIMGLSNVFLITANAFSGSVLILNKDNAEWLKNYILENRTKS